MKSPSCPHHPSMRMRLVSSAEPLFTHTPGRHSTRRELARKAKTPARDIYRCSVQGCPRVEAQPAAPMKYYCRTKGCTKEADPGRIEVNNYICREHYRARQHANDEARRRICGINKERKLAKVHVL